MSEWTRIDYACRHCGVDLIAKDNYGMHIQGLRNLEYRHVGGSPTCTTVHRAQPFDGWDATRKYEEAKGFR